MTKEGVMPTETVMDYSALNVQKTEWLSSESPGQSFSSDTVFSDGILIFLP